MQRYDAIKETQPLTEWMYKNYPPIDKDEKEFNCQYLDESNKPNINVFGDPCSLCANPKCPKRKKVYL